MKTWCLSCKFMRLAGECEHIRGRVYEPPLGDRMRAKMEESRRENVCSGGQQNVMAANVPKTTVTVGDITIRPARMSIDEELKHPECFVGRTFAPVEGTRRWGCHQVKFNGFISGTTLTYLYMTGPGTYDLVSWAKDYRDGCWQEVTP